MEREDVGSTLRRGQARVDLRVTARAVLHSGPTVTGVLRDLSWGGASFWSSHLVFQRGTRMLIELPWRGGERFTVHGEVLRSELNLEGRLLVAVRFYLISLAGQRKLEKLLKVLIPDNGSARAIVKAIAIPFRDATSYRDLLDCIAVGQVAVMTHIPVEVDEGVALGIPIPGKRRPLELRARVLRLHTYEGQPGHEVALTLEHPVDELRELAEKLTTRVTGER